MIGDIIGIDGNTVMVKLSININEVQSLINLYTLLEDSNKKTVGEITDIKEGIAYINMLGEIKEGHFISGITRKPSFGASVKLIAPDKINFIKLEQRYKNTKYFIKFNLTSNTKEIRIYSFFYNNTLT